jgi:hypothetical protein
VVVAGGAVADSVDQRQDQTLTAVSSDGDRRDVTSAANITQAHGAGRINEIRELVISGHGPPPVFVMR